MACGSRVPPRDVTPKASDDLERRDPTNGLVDRLRRAVERLEERRDKPSTGMMERARLEGKIEGVKLAASYLEEGERIFGPKPKTLTVTLGSHVYTYTEGNTYVYHSTPTVGGRRPIRTTRAEPKVDVWQELGSGQGTSPESPPVGTASEVQTHLYALTAYVALLFERRRNP